MNLLVLFALTSAAYADSYTSMVDLRNMVHTERSMLDTLDQYIKEQEKYLQKLKETSREIREKNNEALGDPEMYMAHPVNAFLAVKRLFREWTQIEVEIYGYTATSDYETNMSQYRNYLPVAEDFTGAAIALLRIQDTYQLDVRDIADGTVKGVTKYQPTMAAEDLFEVGREAYDRDDHYHCKLWMKEALRRLNIEREDDNNKAENGRHGRLDIPTVLGYLAWSTYQTGDVEEALKLTEELLAFDPEHGRWKANKALFEEDLKRSEGAVDRSPSKAAARELDDTGQKYEALCRGDNRYLMNMTDAESARILKCSYQHYDVPALYLSPAKEEILFPDPLLIYYRDMLDAAEINHLKDAAAPKLERAKIGNDVTGGGHSETRTSQSAWLAEISDEVVRRVRKRVQAYTRLDFATAEDIQVCNYGIGGHYNPHLDYFETVPETGNRIATVIFYLSNVEAGGATVFPNCGARVVPSEGDAAFWYNLHRNGEGDDRTLHAACPVLSGSKWVANIWIHEVGQEFRRPCSTDPEE